MGERVSLGGVRSRPLKLEHPAMRIGFIIYGSLDTVSGGYLYDRKLVEFLRAQGDTVEIISLPWRNYASHLTDNLRFRLPPDFDLIIEDELNHPSLLFANQKQYPFPIVSLVHHLRCSELRPGWQNNLYRLVEMMYLQNVDGFIFNSKTTRSVVNELVGDDKPFIIAYPPTDRFGKPFSENEVRARANGEELRILFLGNVIYRKGLHTLLKAVNQLKTKVKVDVVGGLDAEPKYASEMQRYVLTRGLSSAVVFHGPLDNEPLIEMYKQAHVMVVPSSYEGYGIVYIEGMGFGLPAIGTTAGAAREIITHGEDGFLIEPDDVNSLSTHIRELSGNRKLLTKLSLNALKRYGFQPRWEETAARIRDFLYERASASNS